MICDICLIICYTVDRAEDGGTVAAVRRRPRIANGCRAAVKESLILNRDVTPFSYRRT